MATTTIKRILIVRNDSTTAWEQSTYVLKKGELGIGYLNVDGIERPIMKVGDGKNVWKNLSQSEYILEEDQIINFDFGRHKAIDGVVNAGGMGMTLSEWFLDALKSEQEPNIILPNFNVSVSIPTSPSLEVGSVIEKIIWNGQYIDGQYEYGSLETKEKDAGTVPLYSITYNGANYIEPTGEHVLTDTYISTAGENNLGNLNVHYAWSDAERTPINSQGKALPEKRIIGGAIDFTLPCIVDGYREGCYYGFTSENFSESIITNDFVRNLQGKLGANYSPQTITCQIPIGATAIVLACPEEFTGPISVLNTTANVEMWQGVLFTKVVRAIGGADSDDKTLGSFSTNYNVYYYKPAYPYEKPTDLIIKIGE